MSMEEHPSRATRIVVLVAAAVGAALVLVGTWRFGPGMIEDGVSYVAAARGLISGDGFVEYDGTPLLYWPPLYPAVLATGLGQIDPVAVVPWVNAGVFALVILVGGLWLRSHVASRPLFVLGVLALVSSVPLLRLSVMTLSGPLFSLLVLLSLWFLERFLDRKMTGWLLVSAGFAALACLTRYVGYTVVAAGVLVLLWNPRRRFAERLASAVIWLLISVLPIAGWLTRNYLVSGTLAGTRGAARRSLVEGATYAVEQLSVWVLPRVMTPPHRVIGLGAAALVLALLLGALCRRRRDAAQTVVLLAVFVVVYLVGLVSSAAVVGFGYVSWRLLAPVYVPLVLLGMLAAHGVGELFTGRILRGIARVLMIVVVGAWLAYPVARTASFTHKFLVEGTGGFAAKAWKDSATIGYLKAHAEQGLIHSNSPEAVYYFLERQAMLGPRATFPSSTTPTRDLDAFRILLVKHRTTRYVWFRAYAFRKYLCTLDDLRAEYDVSVETELADGIVYRIRAR